MDICRLNEFIKCLSELGLDGLEVFNTTKITRLQTLEYLYLAKKYCLLTTAGSDFHNIKDCLGVENEYSNQLIKRYIK